MPPTLARGGDDTAPALLRLLTWLSPAFPTGAFAYSHGLEWAVEARRRHATATRCATGSRTCCDTAPAAPTRSCCATPTAPSGDYAALNRPRRRHRAVARAPRRDAGPGHGVRRRRRGVAARPTCRSASPIPSRSAPSPALHGIDEDATAAAYLQAFAANLISAAVRLVPLGQTAGPARPRRTRTGHPARRGGNARGHARRSRRLRLPLRHRRHAPRNPIHEAVPLMRHSPQRPAARRHRRPGRHRQDRADGRAVQAASRAATTSPRSPTTSTPRRTPSS